MSLVASFWGWMVAARAQEGAGERQGAVRTLDSVRAPVFVQVLRVRGDRPAALLAQLEIREGQVLEVQRSAPLGGPVLVRSGGTTVAVSRAVARHVAVRVLP